MAVRGARSLRREKELKRRAGKKTARWTHAAKNRLRGRANRQARSKV
jgi:hypothetical protein